MKEEEYLNKVNEIFRQFLPRSPCYRYWADEKKNRYFWTTERVKGKFVAGIYRYFKTKKYHKLVKSVHFSKRKTAKARAYKWYQKARKVKK